MSSLKGFSTRTTPQSKPIPGKSQIENSAGGYVFEIDPFERLRRFLILGSETTYYASGAKLTDENAESILALLKVDGPRVVQTIVDISTQGRAPKNDQAIFALALASVHGDMRTRKLAYDNLSSVCRIGTHLFQFVAFRKQFGGWSGGSRRAVSNWYLDKPADDLAYQLVKYRNREGWTHRDVLRAAHPKPTEPLQNAVLAWAACKPSEWEVSRPMPAVIEGFEKAQIAKTPEESAELISEYGLPREAIQTEHLTHPDVWEALLYSGKHGMPMTAMLRNLATMTRLRLLTSTSQATTDVVNKLLDKDAIQKSRLHPLAILMAQRTYAAGHGSRGSNTWVPVGDIVEALNEAFYLAFENVESTGKRRCIALDVSGSMWSGVFGGDVANIPGFTSAAAAAAMAMTSVRSGDPYEVIFFTAAEGRGYWGGRAAPNSIYPGVAPLTLTRSQRLDDVERLMDSVSRYMGPTDCALPMLWARADRREFDVFEIYTDNESWDGEMHASQALAQYRRASGIEAKLVVVATTATSFSVADPSDPGMMDVVGFDSAAPAVIHEFIAD